MAGSIQQTQQELAALETAVTTLASEFEKVYHSYLTALGEAVYKQLILACYHLCTHGYPESFLQLSFSQRQNFQQNLQQLSTKAQTELLQLVNSQQPLPESDDLPEFTSDDESQTEEVEQVIGEIEQAEEAEQSKILNRLQLLLQPNHPQTPPEQLAEWQEQIESAISRQLSQLSRETNFLIQEYNIFAPKLPEAILEVASQADTSAEAVAGPPNLLNIMIETEDADEPQSASITRLMTVHLRLSEIEFADAASMAQRHQIRHLSGQLSQLKHDYHKKQREKAVLEAEAAWRASWFDPD
ncbi:MAG: hypothetical protein WBA13_13015 [Microcoleaceae cyanobacterium]